MKLKGNFEKGAYFEEMGMGEALFVIRKFLEDHEADEDTMKAWELLRDNITKIIGEMMKLS